jgi:two-component system NtrC family response regulator
MKKILIVEDNQDIQNQLRWGLSKTYEILQAMNRTDAIELFTKNMPPVVTLDLGLPPDEHNATEGLACLREILNKAPNTKVIVVSGNTDRENTSKVMQMGAFTFSPKPFNIHKLTLIIQKAFQLLNA